MKMLISHPIAQDETCADQFDFQIAQNSGFSGVQICVEEQGGWSYFVVDGDELKPNPPVHFFSTVDLDSFGGPVEEKPVVAFERFSEFLWQSICQHICYREQTGNALSPVVQGILFEGELSLENSFKTVPPTHLPAGVRCFCDGTTIVEPELGYAAFLNAKAESQFIDFYRPAVTTTWR